MTMSIERLQYTKLETYKWDINQSSKRNTSMEYTTLAHNSLVSVLVHLKTKQRGGERIEEKEWRTGMAGMRGAVATEGSSNNTSEASEVARTSTWSPLANTGPQVCEERRHNRYDGDSEHGIDGMDNQSGSPMQAMGAFVLAPEEECIMESEMIRLR